MPLPALLIPLAIAGGSAVAQAAAKLRSHERLNALRAELQELESHHREEILPLYEQQVGLCHRLGLPEPEYPASLQENTTLLDPPPLWRRLLRRQKRTVADGSPHSRTTIIGRQGAGFAAGTVWKVWSATILNLLRPVGAKLLTLFPGAAPAVGTTSSLVFGISFAVRPGHRQRSRLRRGAAPACMGGSSGKSGRCGRPATSWRTIRTRRHEELTAYTARTRLLQRNVRMRAYTSCRVRHRVRQSSGYTSRRRRGKRAVAHPGRAATTDPAPR